MRIVNSTPADNWRDVDLADPFTYVNLDAHSVWTEMRRLDPVHWNCTRDGRGYWSITKFKDADRVLRDHNVFTSERGTLLNLLDKGDPAGGKQMAATDPPAHTRMRATLQAALSFKAVESYRAKIQQRVLEAVATIPHDQTFDFAALMASIPMAVTGSLMGIPPEDWKRLEVLTWTCVAPDDPEFLGPHGVDATLSRAHRELFAYFVGLVEERRRNLGEDLISLLIRDDLNNDHFDHGRVVSNCYSLLLGANVTTPQVPTAALHQMILDRSIFHEWGSDPKRLIRGVDEALRWSSPANHFMRYATEDVRLGDTIVKKGQATVVWLGSANRDEDVYSDPFKFDVNRRPNKHLAFGIGPHYCVGHTVARVTLQEIFRALFHQFDDFEATDAPDHLASNFVAGVKHFKVTASRCIDAGYGIRNG